MVAATIDDTVYLRDIHLLCVTCRQPIRGTVTTERWIKVEWISPDGECRECVRKAKEADDGIPARQRA